MATDFPKALRMAVDTGKVEFGSRKALKLSLHAKPKLLVLASNCPKLLKLSLESYAKSSSVPLKQFPGTALELGSVCGKPFPVLALSILDPGNSSILQA